MFKYPRPIFMLATKFLLGLLLTNVWQYCFKIWRLSHWAPNMSTQEDQVVMPGDIHANVKTFKGVSILGPGLRRGDDLKSLVATRGGRLRFKSKNVYWVDNQQKRYVPKKGDLVVGVVAKKAGDAFKIDIGASEYAALSVFAFEGATKKQKPDLQVGDAVYAKLLTAHREMEPELICIDKYFKAYNLGPLSNDGFIITLVPNLIHKLLTVGHPLLPTLGKKYTFEIAVGLNGKVWINTKSTKDTLNLMNALYAAQFQSDKDIVDLCRQY